MESEVVHSPSETPGGISSRGMQFPAWRRASSARARFFLIWFCKTRTQKIARSYSDSGELQTAPFPEGERALLNKNTPQLQQAAVPITSRTFGHLSSPLHPHLRWDLGAEPRGACVDRTNPFSWLRKAAASQEGGFWQGDLPQPKKDVGAPAPCHSPDGTLGQ